ncbi:MAG: hypothetical protein ACFCVH_23155 [Alphaproteobacteria bacterium]
MALGVVTHFGQGWDIGLQEEAAALNAKLLRDGINWTLVETTPGNYDFSHRRTGFPAAIDSRFATIINFSYPNPHYDQGFTPHTDAGRQAHAAFVVATLDRFPDIDIIEIGNEFNAGNFVTGPVRTDPYEQRTAYYFELLRAVYLAVKQRHPDVQVLGGATHSIPVAYLRELFALGALDYMDGIAVHPYTSLPEHLGDHLAVLRAAMGGDAVPIHVTEFSQEVSTPAEAAPYLVKMVTVMAASGVATAAWYALLEQPYYRNMGLLETDRASRPASRAFSFIQSILDSFGNPQDVSPDDRLSRVYRYGDRVLVAWGIPREIRLGTGVTAYDAEGRTIGGRPLYLDENDPVILVADRPIVLGQDIAFGATDVVGDSLFQFDVVNDGTDARGGAWSYFALNGEGRRETLHTRGGGAVSDEAWRPYIGHDWLRPLAVEPTSVTPVDFADGQVPKDQYSVVERFTAAEAGIVAIEGSWRVSQESEDGILLTIVVDGTEIYSQTTAGELVVAMPAVQVEAGSTIEFIVGVNGNARGGDRTVRRIQILRGS